MFKTVVNFNTKIKEAASFGQPISEYDPASKGQADFRALAEEAMSFEGKNETHEMVNNLADQLDKISTSADELLAQVNNEQPEVAPEPEPIKIDESSVIPEPIEMPEPVEVQQPQEQIPELLPIEEEQPVAQEMPEPIEIAEEAPAAKSVDEKLCEYYGLHQIDQATMFVSLYPHADDVAIAGDFNSWHPGKTKMKRVGESGVWQAKMELPPGRYRYRLVVDGKWQQDPYNEMAEMNPYGEMNSILEIK